MKIKSAIAAFVSSALLFGSSAAFANTEITVQCWDQYFNVKAMKMAAERYEAKHPDVTIKVEDVAQNDLIQRLNASLGANNLRSLPDIVLIEDYRVQNFLIGYPDFLKELGPHIDMSKFVDHKIAASSDNSGKHYGIPFDSGVSSTYVRMDLFEQAGYKIEDLQDITWDQFIDMGKKVKEVTGINLLAYDPNDLGLLRIMMQSAGSWYTNADGTQVNIANNEALKEGLRIFKRFSDEGVVGFYSGWNQSLTSFQQGDVASVTQGCWLTRSVEAATDQSGKWRVVPFPKINVANATHYSNLGGSQWYVNNYSKNADAAIQFLKETFASDEDLLNELVPTISLVTSLKDTSKITNYNVENAFFGNQKIYAEFAEWNNHVPAISYGPHTYAIDSLMSEALQRIVAGEDIDTVLEETQLNAEMQVGL